MLQSQNKNFTHHLRSNIFYFDYTNLRVSKAETIQIEFTEYDPYSIEVAHIDVGDNIKWLPKNEEYIVNFFAGPEMSLLPTKSDTDEVHSFVFKVPGVY